MKSSAASLEIKAIRLSHGLGLPLPQYQTEEAAGVDLMAAVPLTSPLRLLPGMRQLVPTGLSIEIPAGFEGQVRPRSGLALNHGVTVLNAPGTIDSDYRGEVKVLLINHGRETFVITRGQRIAQLVVQAVTRATFVDVRAVAASRRGEAGWGSTGLGEVVPAVVTASQPAPVAAPKAATAPSAPFSAARRQAAAAATNDSTSKKSASPAAPKSLGATNSPAKSASGTLAAAKAPAAGKTSGRKPAASKAPVLEQAPAAKRPATAKSKAGARA